MEVFTTREVIPPTQRAIGATRVDESTEIPRFITYDERFATIIGPQPSLTLAITASQPLYHEAGVYIPSLDKVFVTSNRYIDPSSGSPTIDISELSRQADGTWKAVKVDAGIVFANGGVNYGSGVLFCQQGDLNGRGGLVYMDATTPYKTKTLLDSYQGRWFNSVNDVVVKSDGSIWFTDPIYGFEQGFRPQPQLPCHVYRFDPASGDVRVVADGFGRPNGLAFSPDEQTLYITDTDWIHGDGSTDDNRPSTIYAYDVIRRAESDFLANRRVFAMADSGIPDGIKCDTIGNVYSGCGDGVSAWSAGGTLLGKIAVPGGVANFCFARKGELLLLNEEKFWVARIGDETEGALLANM